MFLLAAEFFFGVPLISEPRDLRSHQPHPQLGSRKEGRRAGEHAVGPTQTCHFRGLFLTPKAVGTTGWQNGKQPVVLWGTS